MLGPGNLGRSDLLKFLVGLLKVGGGRDHLNEWYSRFAVLANVTEIESIQPKVIKENLIYKARVTYEA